MKRSDWFEWLLHVIGYAAIVVVGLLGLASLIAPRLACSAGLSTERAAELYAVAYGYYGAAHGGVRLPQQAPAIRLRAHAQICGDWGLKPGCEVQAYYDEREIVISESLDFWHTVHASFLLHEFIHYLQHQIHGPARDCARWLAYEQEAYELQAQYLARVGEHEAAQNARYAARIQSCRERS